MNVRREVQYDLASIGARNRVTLTLAVPTGGEDTRDLAAGWLTPASLWL